MKKQEIKKELEAISPLLASVPDSDIHKVPEGYFEQLPIHVVAKLAGNTMQAPEGYFEQLPKEIIRNTKSKNGKGKWISLKFYRIATAAAVAGLIGIGIYAFFYFQKSNNSSLLSETYAMKEAGEIIKNNNFDEKMSNLSDEEVIDYLEQNGHDVTAALIASLSDDKNLPSETDFMSNENELNEFLNQHNILLTEPIIN